MNMWLQDGWQQNDSKNYGIPYPHGTAPPKPIKRYLSTFWVINGTFEGIPHIANHSPKPFDKIYPSTFWKTDPTNTISLVTPYITDHPVKGIDYDHLSALFGKMEEDLNLKVTGVRITNPIVLGTCAYCTNLSKVTIPKSCKKIGPYAFYKTKLTEVTVPSDCEYSETSFPPNCTIKKYK